ncbi:Gag-Pol protein [Plakobranchus ocellatus]|uniref:Gag-Pol protein n=1 Tax=Plakobranchus ocellatus TaxID=259542 RepID=A0AAV4DN38_9GAST|nr:Gag-Pol protein [Plakobranchus ocellatus]
MPLPRPSAPTVLKGRRDHRLLFAQPDASIVVDNMKCLKANVLHLVRNAASAMALIILPLWRFLVFLLSKIREILKNAKTKKKFNAEFVVCEQDVQPILGLRAAEQMGLLSLQSANFEEVFSLSSLDCLPVFNDKLGQFPGQQHLTTDPNVKSGIMPNRRVPTAVRGRFKQELDRLTELGVLAPVT